VADIQQLAERDDDRAIPAERVDTASIVSATVQDGNTVLTFGDGSTMTFVGVARLGQPPDFGRGRFPAPFVDHAGTALASRKRR